MPFVYYNVAAGDQIAEISERMAMAADMKVRASSTAATGAYSSACRRGLPAILMERGGGGRFTEEEVAEYKQDIRNIMITLGMIPGVEQHTEKQRNVTTAEYLEAETDGLWYPEKKPERHSGKGASGGSSQYLGRTPERIPGTL